MDELRKHEIKQLEVKKKREDQLKSLEANELKTITVKADDEIAEELAEQMYLQDTIDNELMNTLLAEMLTNVNEDFIDKVVEEVFLE